MHTLPRLKEKIKTKLQKQENKLHASRPKTLAMILAQEK